LTHIRDHAATKNVSRKIGPRQATKPGREQLQAFDIDGVDT
jgi:hypothetical protein